MPLKPIRPYMTQPMIFVDLLLLLLLTPPHLGARHMSRLPAGSQYTSITADLEKDDLPCIHLTRSTLISRARVRYAYVCCCCCIQGTICRPCGLDRVLNQELLCRRCPQPTIHQFETQKLQVCVLQWPQAWHYSCLSHQYHLLLLGQMQSLGQQHFTNLPRRPTSSTLQCRHALAIVSS